MVNIVNPKVEVIDYGPKRVIDNVLDVPFSQTNCGEIIIPRDVFEIRDGKLVIPQNNLIPRTMLTPDQVVYSAAGITFKDTDFFDQATEALSETDDSKVTESIIGSVGGGHASLTTTPGLWFLIKGNASKLVDSIFTGETHGSFLMPSGRRIPIAKEQIVVPAGLASKGKAAVDLYMKTSEANIDAYETLMQKGIPKEEAAKIVQYGHRGGGFLYMPLETVISLSRRFARNIEAIPREGREVVHQLEQFIQEHGLERGYASRLNSPRLGSPSPGIFHYDKSMSERVEAQLERLAEKPVVVESNDTMDNDRDHKIVEYLRRKEEVFRDPKKLERGWYSLLGELDQIVGEYNNSVSVTTLANSPWRVWGEVKRHRTLDQTAESVYHAAQRVLNVVRNTAEYVRKGENEDFGFLLDEYGQVFSIPPAVKKDNNVLNYWLNRVVDSFEAYESLRKMGVADSDAIAVIPRGMKLGIEKRFDLANLASLYMPLRLCNTCEPEMRRTTEQERDLILLEPISKQVKDLIGVKCSATGYCPEGSYEKRCCKKVCGYVPGYNAEVHQQIQSERKGRILHRIESGPREQRLLGHENFMP